MRFLVYNRVATDHQQDPEQAARCRTLLKSIMAEYPDTMAATYVGRESPFRRITSQPELTQEKPIP
jgi:hypothetical protein